MKIIDMHAHIAGIGAGNSGCYISPALRRSWKFKAYLKSFGVTERELHEHGDSLIVKRFSEELSQSKYVQGAVILAMDGVSDKHGELDYDLTELYIPNHYLSREVGKYKNLYYGASVNPYLNDARPRLEQAAKDGAVLIKWLPSIQHIDPADKKLVPFYQCLSNLGLPLLTHTGTEQSFTQAVNEFADPDRLTLALDNGVTVIAAHAGAGGSNKGVDNMSRLSRLFKKYSHLYADISALTQINRKRYLPRVLKEKNFEDRLLYGTDMPLLKTGLTSPLFHIFDLSLHEFTDLMKTKNPWDRDVKLKKTLGVPESVFAHPGKLLRIH